VLRQLGSSKVPISGHAADQGYKGRFTEDAQQKGWHVEIAQKPEPAKGFVPKRTTGLSSRPSHGLISGLACFPMWRNP
jgi:hypothetical protein